MAHGLPEIHRAVGRLEGKVDALTKDVAGVDGKIDKVDEKQDRNYDEHRVLVGRFDTHVVESAERSASLKDDIADVKERIEASPAWSWKAFLKRYRTTIAIIAGIITAVVSAVGAIIAALQNAGAP